MVTGALADLLFKVAQNRGMNAASFLFYQSAIFTTTIWAIGIASGQVPDIRASTWAFGLPAGVLAYTGLLLFVMSLKEGTASVNVPIFRLNFVVTAVGAVAVLHEPVNAAKVAGIFLAVAGVLSLADPAALRRAGSSGLRPMLLLVAGTVAFGAVGIINKEAANQGHATIPLILTTTIAFNGLALLRMAAGKDFGIGRTTARYAPIIGLLQLAWTVLFIQSLQSGQASVNAPIAQLSFVLTAMLAVAWLKEAASRRLVVGLSASTLAVAAFALA